MIVLENVSKQFGQGAESTEVLRDVTATFPRNSTIGILGPRRAGKSTLLSLIRRAMLPDRGRVVHNMSVSWPLGAVNVFQKMLSYRTNIRFLAQLHGAFPPDVLRRTIEFAGLGPELDYAVRETPREIQARAMYATCLSLGFDCYLIDESMFVGDDDFRKKSDVFLRKMRNKRTFIITTRKPQIIREYCDVAFLLHEGALVGYDRRDEAIRSFKKI